MANKSKNKNVEPLRLEEVGIIFKNLRGEKSMYNEAGERHFSIFLDDMSLVQNLIEKGWNLKPLRDEEGVVYAYHLPVKLNYAGKVEPRIVKVSSSDHSQQLTLTEATVEMLDYLPIEFVDIVINPYSWSVNGKSGIAAYCKTMYAIIREDDLDLKWSRALTGE